MSGQPLLKFPFLVQQKIIRLLMLFELFEFFLTSKRVLNLIKHAKVHVDNLLYEIQDKDMAMFLNRGCETLVFSTAQWGVKGSYRQLTKPKLAISKADSYFRGTETRRDIKPEHDTDESHQEALEKLTDYLLLFMKFGKVQLRCYRNGFSFASLFVWSRFPHFGEVGYPISDEGRRYTTVRNLEFLLEEVHTETLNLCVAISDNDDQIYKFRKQEESKVANLHIFCPFRSWRWIDIESLLKMDNKTITVWNSLLEVQVNVILKSWISGENEKLEEVNLNMGRVVDNFEVLLAGIVATPTVLRRQVEGAMDIKREKDGLQATVYRYENFISMLVWTEEHLKAIEKI